MEGKNSTGRRVSLLNGPPARPGVTPLIHSRASSYAQTNSSYSTASQAWSPVCSPCTPDLLRSDSWSSSQQTDPSAPPTPHSACEEMDSTKFRSLSSPDSIEYYGMAKTGGLPDLLPGRSLSNSSIDAADQDKSLKKRHPCGLAAKTGCDKMFTTSGHAARHAKVHTGEKDTPCPECGKYFARVDNMKQHLKTHKKDGSSRGLSSMSIDSKKAKLAKSSSPKSSVNAQPSPYQYLDEAKPVRPGMAQRANAYSYQMPYSAASGQAPISPYGGTESAGGLEALASACQISR